MVGRLESRCGFELDDQTGVDDEVNPLAWDLDAAVVDEDRPFTLETDSPQLQLDTQRFLVDPFEKPRTQDPVHFNRRAYGFFRGTFYVRRDRSKVGHVQSAFVPLCKKVFVPLWLNRLCVLRGHSTSRYCSASAT